MPPVVAVVQLPQIYEVSGRVATSLLALGLQRADDLGASEAAAAALGATRADEQPAPDQWIVLLDPSGHQFCVSTLIPEP